MVTLQQAAQQALETLTMYQDFIKKGGLTFRHGEEAITALRQALEADAKPCACCGEGNARISVTRVCDTCGSEYAGQAEMDMAKRIEAEPVAWINWCAATGQRSLGWQCESELASEPLYHAPQPAQQPLTGGERAVERDEMLQVALNFIETLTGMQPPPIEIAPPEVFAPFRDFVDRIQAVADRRSSPLPKQKPLTEEKIADLFSVACRETFSGLERFIYFTRLVESFHNIK